ncbi:hypothetical protein BRC99_07370 [Halobacteriales archaeon QS_7_69_60]|nr:MAG: hypothetical protein BRC99_07370 [Halobacteriales archaeon QS_7_69_60]
MRDSDIEDATRRAVLKTVAGAAGIGAAGTASAQGPAATSRTRPSSGITASATPGGRRPGHRARTPTSGSGRTRRTTRPRTAPRR